MAAMGGKKLLAKLRDGETEAASQGHTVEETDE